MANPSNDDLHLPRFDGFSGEVRLPGSKSIANRALLLAALSQTSRDGLHLTNLPIADDVQVLMRTLPALGVHVEDAPVEIALAAAPDAAQDAPALTIRGAGGPFPIASAKLNLDNAGTALRPLTAVLCAGQGDYVIDGNEQMRRRPIRDLTEGLGQLGVQIDCAPNGGPPVHIQANGLRGGRIQLSGRVSSQYISAVLMAAPLARDEDIVLELPEEPVSKPYIDLTIDMMSDFGISVEREGYMRYRVPRGVYRLRKASGPAGAQFYSVEGDASAATYFLAAGSLPGCGPVVVRGVDRRSRQGDAAFADLLKEMGASIRYGDGWIEARGPEAGTKLRALDRDMNDMPDAAMTLAVLALFADGETHIRNIANLRVKESERIRGLRLELEKLGAAVVEEEDALHVSPPQQWQPARIETYHDHRMAMAFALAAFGTEVNIVNPGCVSKTYARFFDDFVPLTKSPR